MPTRNTERCSELVESHGAAWGDQGLKMTQTNAASVPSSPLSLIAELTHRCPLHCLYCSNPLEMQRAESGAYDGRLAKGLSAGRQDGSSASPPDWRRASGAEDLPELIRAGRDAGLYVNMITSGVGLTEDRLATLVEAGLEHLQLSFQDLDEVSANHIAGTRAHAIKLALVPILKRYPWRSPSTSLFIAEPRPSGGVHCAGRRAATRPAGDQHMCSTTAGR